MRIGSMVAMIVAAGCAQGVAEGGESAVLARTAPGFELDVPTAVAGAPLSLTAVGVSPGERVYFVRGARIGNGPCVQAAAGLCLDVTGAQLVGSANADATGAASLSVVVPPTTPLGTQVAVQALVLRGVASAPVEVVVTDAGIATVADLVAGDLLITEVMADPAAVSDTRGEWFEIRNMTDRQVDLRDLRISDLGTDAWVVPTSLVIAPLGFAVLGPDADTASNGGVRLDLQTTGLTLANTEDELVLSHGGTIIDTLAWSALSGFTHTPGASMSLSSEVTDAAIADGGGSWCDAGWTYGAGDRGSPGVLNDSCSAVDLDLDGYANDVDCDDADPTIHPGAVEACDGVDQDCDGRIDDGAVATVDDGTTWATVSSAVSHAADHSEIVVCPGRYVGSVTIDHPVTLRGRDGSGSTVLDGSGTAHVVTIRSSDVTLEGFTVTGGVLPWLPPAPEPVGAGIWIWSNATGVMLSDLWVTGNVGSSGAGIGILGGGGGGTVSMTDVRLTDNTADRDGGGLAVWGSALSGGVQLDLTRVSITDNTASDGGAAYAMLASVTLVDSELLRNTASFEGGALDLYDTDVTMTDTDVLWNTAARWGGAVELDGTSQGALWVDGGDWGTGPTDNTPQDVALHDAAYTYGYGDQPHFTCVYPGGGLWPCWNH